MITWKKEFTYNELSMTPNWIVQVYTESLLNKSFTYPSSKFRETIEKYPEYFTNGKSYTESFTTWINDINYFLGEDSRGLLMVKKARSIGLSTITPDNFIPLPMRRIEQRAYPNEGIMRMLLRKTFKSNNNE